MPRPLARDKDVHVQFEEEVKKRLRALAAADQRTVSSLVRRVVMTWLESQKAAA
jgi:predicted DNA-binding protein